MKLIDVYVKVIVGFGLVITALWHKLVLLVDKVRAAVSSLTYPWRRIGDFEILLLLCVWMSRAVVVEG